jgi:hypothetical protein
MLKSIADRVKIKGFKKQPMNRDGWLFDSEAEMVHQPSSDIRPDQFPDPGETDDCVEEAEPAASGPGERDGVKTLQLPGPSHPHGTIVTFACRLPP